MNEESKQNIMNGIGHLQRIQLRGSSLSTEELNESLGYIEKAVNAHGISLDEQKQLRAILVQYGRESRGSATGVVARGVSFIRNALSQDNKVSTHRKPEDWG